MLTQVCSYPSFQSFSSSDFPEFVEALDRRDPYESHVLFTEAKCSAALEHNHHNRKLFAENLETLKNALKLGRYDERQRKIAFVRIHKSSKSSQIEGIQKLFTPGVEDILILADGQHLLTAGLQTGIPFKVTVRWNINESQWREIDRGRPRSEANCARLYYGTKDETKNNAILSQYLRIHDRYKKPLNDEIADFYNKNSDILDLFNDVLDGKSGRMKQRYGEITDTRNVSTAPVKAALLLAYQKYPKETEEFLRDFATQNSNSFNQIPKKVFTKIRDSQSRLDQEIHYLILSSLIKWINRVEIKMFSTGSNDSVANIIKQHYRTMKIYDVIPKQLQDRVGLDYKFI